MKFIKVYIETFEASSKSEAKRIATQDAPNDDIGLVLFAVNENGEVKERVL